MNIGSTAGSSFTNAASNVVQVTEQVQRVAQDVADATTSRPVEGVGKLATAMTDLKQQEVQMSASVKVMQAADSNLGSLIDTNA
ncbi:MAG: hypothetical protein P1U57_05930 [Oleibacter sp.]|nr:hypothetical protein [Thalassolituus sp.]